MRINKNCPSDTLTEKDLSSRLQHGRPEPWVMRVVQGAAASHFQRCPMEASKLLQVRLDTAKNTSRRLLINTFKTSCCDEKHF